MPAPPKVQAWECELCTTQWAITTVRPDSRTAVLLGDLTATAREIRRLRWTWQQIITLATDAPHLADVELRTRLLELASSTAQ